MTRHLVIDGGRTGCRIACFEHDRVLARAHGRGLCQGGLAEAFAGLPPGLCGVERVAAGLAGFDGSARSARAVADAICPLVRAELVLVTDDAVISYLGAIGAAPGAVVAAGTGAIALAADGAGRFARSDGWGHLLGDDGAGFSIGRDGLRSALQAHDGRPGSQALRDLAQARFGPLQAVAHRVHAADDPVAAIAAFAPDVAAAAREGDAAAAALWARAARKLAATVAAAARKLFAEESPLTVSWAGGLFAAGDLLAEPFARHVAGHWPNAELSPPHGSPLDGAHLLARTHPWPQFAALVQAVT